MRLMNTIAIIGGGASGMMAALVAARAGANVTLYEHNTTVGKKILASGNGRCNITNTRITQEHYYGLDPSFVEYPLSCLPYARFETFCASLGLLLECKEDGRCYPFSQEAKTVLWAFQRALEASSVKVVTDTNVTAITHKKGLFTVHTDHEKQGGFTHVLIATGSQAAPQMGATGDGYAFAKGLGHTIHPTYPALVQLHLKESTPAKMAGVRMMANVTLRVKEQALTAVMGDILFTAYGISGLAILDISTTASLALSRQQHVSITLELLPQWDTTKLSHVLKTLCANAPQLTLEEALSTLLPLKIIPHLLKTITILPATPVRKLDPKMVKRVVEGIKNWRFEVSDTHGFKHAEASGGGVSTAEVNPKTMESLRLKGLYFAGEVLDIVGQRGGYNFHFAWASGMIAGEAMARSNEI